MAFKHCDIDRSWIRHKLNFKRFFIAQQAIQESIAKSVPEEPPENAAAATTRLRFRVPRGQQLTRRFWAENTLQDVLHYLVGQGFHVMDAE